MIKEETARAQPPSGASTCEWRQQDTANGELETKTNRVTGEAWLFQYDALGNLLSVGLPNGDLIDYLVDGMGRRVGKKKNGVLLKQWIYRDALKPVAELDGGGALVSEFVYGAKSNVPDYVRRGGATYRVVSDHLGSPRHVVNVANSADVPYTASYTSFGEVAGTGLDWMPFGFAGGQPDQETGLVRFGRRDFDGRAGRWTSKDPIRWSSLQTNFYEYAGDDPISQVDSTGLTVYACQERMLDFQHWWSFYYGFNHSYIVTDEKAFGLYPTTNRWWGIDPARIRPEPNFSSDSPQTCHAIPNVDEDCVNSYAHYFALWGDYGPSNNCGTFVAEVLNACQNASSGFEGGEGGPGDLPAPPPFPPGGF